MLNEGKLKSMTYDSLNLLSLNSILRIVLELSSINNMQQKLFEDLIHAKEYINSFEEKVLKIMSS